MTGDIQVVVKPDITSAACVTALETAMGFGKAAFSMEVAVSLTLFCLSPKGADLATKKLVMDIYMKAGYNVSNSPGTDYKTVRRRINTFSDLFKSIGRDAFFKVLGASPNEKAIKALQLYLVEEYDLNGINDVCKLAGNPVKQTNTPDRRAARKAAELIGYNNAVTSEASQHLQKVEVGISFADDPDATIISSGVLGVVVPKTCTSEDMRRIATQLIDLAEKVEEDERKLVKTHTDRRNQTLHS